MPLLKTFTLGCKVNQYETEYLRNALHRIGYRDAGENEIADLVILNTCTVTAQSDLKSRKLVRKSIRENPGAEIVVMGCWASREPEEVRKIPGIGEIITDKRRFPEFLKNRGLVEIPPGIESFGERHRAYVKVQDGCKVGCAYCIIPKVRPHLSSRSLENILEEISVLAKRGYAEIVLTGIHLGHYGIDLQPQISLTQLLRSVLQRIRRDSLPSRIRLSSLEAVEVPGELIELFTEYPEELCPHLHLSIQSGSDEVLRMMKRRYSSESFTEKCRDIQGRIPDLALTTDIIVGFPGESEIHFEQTSRMVERIGFSKVHIFRFSAREGTVAENLPDQVSSQVKKDRAGRLQRIADRLRVSYARSLLGKSAQVLIESVESGGFLSGTCGRYMKVRLFAPKNRPGQLLQVRILEQHGEDLAGKIESP